MTDHPPDGVHRRRDADRLPPYAPRLPEDVDPTPATDPEPTVADAEPAAPAPTPEQLEEAAALAEAQEQGVGDARWPAPETDDAPPVAVEPLLVPGAEPDPATEALAVASVDLDAVADAAPDPVAEHTTEHSSTGIDPETAQLLPEPATARIDLSAPDDAAPTADPLFIRAALDGVAAQESQSHGTATALADPPPPAPPAPPAPATGDPAASGTSRSARWCAASANCSSPSA